MIGVPGCTNAAADISSAPAAQKASASQLARRAARRTVQAPQHADDRGEPDTPTVDMHDQRDAKKSAAGSQALTPGGARPAPAAPRTGPSRSAPAGPARARRGPARAVPPPRWKAEIGRGGRGQGRCGRQAAMRQGIHFSFPCGNRTSTHESGQTKRTPWNRLCRATGVAPWGRRRRRFGGIMQCDATTVGVEVDHEDLGGRKTTVASRWWVEAGLARVVRSADGDALLAGGNDQPLVQRRAPSRDRPDGSAVRRSAERAMSTPPSPASVHAGISSARACSVAAWRVRVALLLAVGDRLACGEVTLISAWSAGGGW